MKKIEMTLTYFILDNRILLPLKKKKIGKGKHNGVGGRLEIGETHEVAMVRECVEEVGVRPIEYDYVAEIVCNNLANNEQAIVHVYICKAWIGTFVETEEMKPHWFDLSEIPLMFEQEKMMDNDKEWLPLVLDGKKVQASFDLDENYKIIKINYINEMESLQKVLN